MQKGSDVKRQVQKGRVSAKRQDGCKKAKGRVTAKRQKAGWMQKGRISKKGNYNLIDIM
jgi:hypothetical protein